MTRVLSGAALAAVALAAILFLPFIGLRVVATLVALLAAREYLAVIHREHGSRGALVVLVLVAATCWQFSAPGFVDILWLLLAALAWLAIEVLFRGLTVERASARFLAPWYIGMPFGMLVAIHAVGGRTATLLLIATVVVSDTAQYYSGRTFGKRPLAPAISPKKTIEGAVGGLIAASLFVTFAGRFVFPLARPLSLFVLGLAIVALGIAGDLFESRLKRVAGIKDSSTLIPGHGGVLDRIDALLFATPAYYLYLQA
jgi:phosphatidate cytidylyltransferase